MILEEKTVQSNLQYGLWDIRPDTFADRADLFTACLFLIMLSGRFSHLGEGCFLWLLWKMLHNDVSFKMSYQVKLFTEAKVDMFCWCSYKGLFCLRKGL